MAAACHSFFRFLGWLTSLAAIVFMAYIIKCWPTVTGAISASLIGAGIAMLNDSWEMIAHVDPTGNFKPLNPPRAVLHDLLSFAACVGGLLLILFADIQEVSKAEALKDTTENWHGDDRIYLRTAQWMLAAVAAWRFIFAVWGACDCARRRRMGQFGTLIRRFMSPV